MQTDLSASLGNRKPEREKEIFGWKKKSKERNRKNEALVKTETLKFTVM
jgi:hypothetical protein